jgi:hypothetical protein
MQIISFQGNSKTQPKSTQLAKTQPNHLPGQPTQGAKPQLHKTPAGDTFIRKPSK